MEKDNTENSYELLHKLVYAEKKVSKQNLKCINITVTIDECQSKPITLKQASIIILALSKLLNRRFKALIEDCGNLLQLLTTKKPLRVPHPKNITLNIEEGTYIENVVDLPTEDRELSMYMDGEELTIGMDMEFGDAPSIEQAREGTMTASLLLDDVNVSVNVKRKRIVQDRMTEISENIFRGNLRSVIDILKKEQAVDSYKPKVWIDEKIARIFEKKLVENAIEDPTMEAGTIEEERRASVDFMPEFAVNPIETMTLCGDESLFDISKVPDVFQFECVIKEASPLEKASSFMTLLVELSHGTIEAQQNSPFGEIECRVVRR